MAKKQITMDADKWMETYKPVLVHPKAVNGIAPEDQAPWSGTMFETYGVELAHVETVAQRRPLTIWTLLDDGATIISGFHYVNRFGYFITEVPFKAGQFIQAVDKEAKAMSRR